MTRAMRASSLGLGLGLGLSLFKPRVGSFAPGLLGALLLVACGGAVPAASGARRPLTPSVEAAEAMPAASLPGVRAERTPGAPPSVFLLPRLPEIRLDPKAPTRPLPELKLENIGLHVGGGPNDLETKAPFQHAIAARFPAFLDCYRQNDDPAKGGRFGIDLHIPRGGGHPRIEQPRTAMRGPEFRACVSAAFESVEFDKPKRGPTTISYSLRFTVGEAP